MIFDLIHKKFAIITHLQDTNQSYEQVFKTQDVTSDLDKNKTRNAKNMKNTNQKTVKVKILKKDTYTHTY